VDRNGDLQIEMAEENSPLLETVLREIKEIGYDEVFPNLNEEHIDDLFPQRGFKIFLHDSYLDFVKEGELTENNMKIINKYLWSRRNDTQ
jgi:hypothetical protein